MSDFEICGVIYFCYDGLVLLSVQVARNPSKHFLVGTAAIA